ncbi:MAG: omptin family outer membrane protease [Treponema sp.]|uniref:omptin family outer membrane protease n=1 Tax=Treponema sp. TaxID=166 RepID=UPI0025E7A5B6|nr:omptin family outer membrane protease [Treponema sp.]MBR0495775.1 omptin family outer membrane protease [Treponema sp.]
MMKKLILSLAIAFFSFSAFAVNLEDFSLSVEPLFGMKWGQVNEYVFSKKSKFSYDKLSELNWEIKPEWYCGLNVQGGWNQFFIETGVKFGIPRKTGLMIDSDWQNIEKTVAGGGNTVKTNYSESDNYLDYDISFGVKGGYKFPIMEYFSIEPAIAFERQIIKFTANGGTAWYGKSKTGGGLYPYNDTAHQTIYSFAGQDVISYKREFTCLWLGTDFSFLAPYSNTLIFNTGFFFAPYVYAVSYDSHLIKEIDYADLTTGFFGAFKWKLGAEYKINDRHSICLNANYFYMRVLRGDDYEKKSSESNYKKSNEADGGAGARYFDLCFSYRFKLF